MLSVLEETQYLLNKCEITHWCFPRFYLFTKHFLTYLSWTTQPCVVINCHSHFANHSLRLQKVKFPVQNQMSGKLWSCGPNTGFGVPNIFWLESHLFIVLFWVILLPLKLKYCPGWVPQLVQESAQLARSWVWALVRALTRSNQWMHHYTEQHINVSRAPPSALSQINFKNSHIDNEHCMYLYPCQLTSVL